MLFVDKRINNGLEYRTFHMCPLSG